jgi:hypothetical protein
MTETLIIIVAAIGVVYWTVWEAQKYFTSGQDEDEELAYTQKRFLRRLAVSLDLLVILAMLKFRTFVEGLAPSFILAYYAACLALVMLLFLLALADLTETSRQLRTVRKNLVESSLAELNKELELAAQRESEQKNLPDRKEPRPEGSDSSAPEEKKK